MYRESKNRLANPQEPRLVGGCRLSYSPLKTPQRQTDLLPVAHHMTVGGQPQFFTKWAQWYTAEYPSNAAAELPLDRLIKER